jgi:methyl-accepting chemotaxis protein
MKLIDFFFSEKDRKGLPPAVSRRIPFLVGMDLLLIAYFLAAAIMRYRAEPAVYGRFLVAVLATEPLFIISLVLVRRGKYKAASYVGGIGPLVNVLWIGLLLPYNQPEELYRFGLYLLGGVVADSMVAIERRQVTAYALTGILIYGFFMGAVILPSPMAGAKDLASIAATIFLLVASVILVVLFMARLNHDLVALSDGANRASREKAEALAGLLEGSREALDTGRELRSVSERSRDDSAAIRKAIEGLGEESRDLLATTRQAEEGNRVLVERAKGLKAAVAEENGLLGETTEALGRITSTVREIAGLAQAKQATIEAVLATADRQGRDLAGLRGGVERSKASTQRVGEAAQGISDISEKIGLLAMNASIEAAHAGAAGKGFGVISLAVRKLAEETKAQIANISEALSESGAAAASSADALERFALGTGSLAGDVRETFDALGAILGGLGNVAREAAELDGKAKELLGLARRSDEEVDGAAAGVMANMAGLERMEAFSERLASSVESILAGFSAIETALNQAVLVSARSADHLAGLDRRLADIDKGNAQG